MNELERLKEAAEIMREVINRVTPFQTMWEFDAWDGFDNHAAFNKLQMLLGKNNE